MSLTHDWLLLRTDYWVAQVVWRSGEGMKLIYNPSAYARNLRMLAHFRALDQDDD